MQSTWCWRRVCSAATFDLDTVGCGPSSGCDEPTLPLVELSEVERQRASIHLETGKFPNGACELSELQVARFAIGDSVHASSSSTPDLHRDDCASGRNAIVEVATQSIAFIRWDATSAAHCVKFV